MRRLLLALAFVPSAAFAAVTPSSSAPGLLSNGDISGTIFTPNYSTSTRNYAAKAADAINLKDYRAKEDGATDDSGAWATAIGVVNARYSLGNYACIYVPPGTSYVGTGTAIPAFTGPGCVRGAGSVKSIVQFSSTFSGNFLTWSEAWEASNYPFAGTAITGNQKAGPYVYGLTFNGNRAATADTVVLGFMDREDFVYLDDLQANFIKGTVLQSGHTLNQTQAYMRESYFGLMRFYNCGDAGYPVVDMFSTGSTIGSNEIRINDLEIYAPYGTGLSLRNNSTGSNGMRDISINFLRIEGQESPPVAIAADLLAIGNASDAGGVTSVQINAAEFIDPYAGYAAIHLAGPTTPLAPYFINITGRITGGVPAGRGIQIDEGHDLQFHMATINTNDVNVQIAAQPATGANITFDCNDGSACNYTYTIDASNTANLHAPVMGGLGVGGFQAPVYMAASSLIAGCPPNSLVSCGNSRGTNAVDLQPNRTVATQVAGAQASTIGGGAQNIIQSSSAYATIVGGFNNNIAGAYSTALGGKQGADSGRLGLLFYSNSSFSTQGDQQAAWSTLAGVTSTATAVRLLSNGATTATTSNCYNMANIRSGTNDLRIAITATDKTAPGHYVYTQPQLMEAWDSTNGTVVSGAGTATAAGSGTLSTLTTSAISITNDSTDRCLNLTFTPPAGNTDTIDVVAVISAAEG